MRVISLIPLLPCLLLAACGGSDTDNSSINTSVFAGNDLQVVEKSEFTISAKGSPADGTFTWQRVSGPIIDVFPLEGAEQTLTAPDVKSDSELILRVSYQTQNGSLVSDDLTVFIASNNQLPVPIVTQIAPENLPSVYKDTVTLSALESTDPDENGKISSYLWQLLSGPDLVVDSFTNPTLSFSHPLLENNSNLKWQLTVTDDEGGVSALQYDMTLNKTAQVIIANAGADQTVEEFDKVILDATASEAATQSYQCKWQQLTGNTEVLIKPQSCTASFYASDIDVNATLSFEVQVMDLKGRTDTDTVFVNVTPKALGLINDTGIGECYNNSQRINCNNDEFPNQDGDVGRDSFANRLGKIGKGDLAFDYTKLDEFADELSDDASNFSCIRDNTTGLVWEVKGPYSGVLPNTTLRDGQNRYIWQGPLNSGDVTGSANTSCPSNTDCGLQTYIDEVNALDFCGGSNWRLPTYTELLGLIDYGKDGQNLLIDTAFFPNTPATNILGHLRYWTSQTAVDGTSLSQAYIIDMMDGNDLAYPKDNVAFVRLVRNR
ncbi:DUF1566 domain-containing protein [Pseudoalteromonas sp.]|uniref:Lcl C-terminal domain-containing protein n=1 Tax=Pseudoalteromonas sp. TaxID=53249 RepID=UPI001BD14680|nr:DUF1566 domain-containing protein [Pseudoalteromonas sp.]